MSHRIDVWDSRPRTIIEHLASVEGCEVALATYHGRLLTPAHGAHHRAGAAPAF